MKLEKIENILIELTKDDTNLYSSLSNISSYLYDELEEIDWLGFYIIKNDYLILGPFQGGIACNNIRLGAGVCGTSAKNKSIEIVPDISKRVNHIACSSLTRSEAVYPIIVNDRVVAVLDMDSNTLNRFIDIDNQILDYVNQIQSIWERYLIKVLFVCHGNICRSPSAEYILKDIVKKEGIESLFVIELNKKEGMKEKEKKEKYSNDK
jgi:GAF domain-containing protein